MNGTARHLNAFAIAQELNAQYAGVQEAFVAIFPPPPVMGIGQTGGFKLYVEDRAGLGFEELYTQTQARGQAGLCDAVARGAVFQLPGERAADRRASRSRARKTYGVPLTEVFDTLQVYLGSVYANDFNRFGRTYQVNVQAESEFRLQPEQIRNLKTRNAAGNMVPLGSLVTIGRGYGPDQVMHYNGYPAAEISGAPAPGFSSGQAQAAMAQILEQKLPRGMSCEWTELAYQEMLSGNTMIYIFPLCVLLVYVVLAARCELDASAQRHPDRADDAAVGDRGRVAHQRRQQRLYANQLPGAGGPGLQERDSDRRVRQASRGTG